MSQFNPADYRSAAGTMALQQQLTAVTEAVTQLASAVAAVTTTSTYQQAALTALQDAVDVLNGPA